MAKRKNTVSLERIAKGAILYGKKTVGWLNGKNTVSLERIAERAILYGWIVVERLIYHSGKRYYPVEFEIRRRWNKDISHGTRIFRYNNLLQNVGQIVKDKWE